jgi:hypothetical protein
MRTRLAIPLLLFAAGLAVAQSDVIDGIVVIVNGRPILRSEWDDAARFERLANGLAPAALTEEERNTALNRLIDQMLILQQMERAIFARAGAEDVQARLRELRALHPAAASDDQWRVLLATYGLTEADVVERVTQQFNILRFVELRFRPSVFVPQASIEQYYRETFLPELRRSGATEIPLRQVSAQIREVLVQRRLDELTTTWLESLRTQSTIVRRKNGQHKAAAQ